MDGTAEITADHGQIRIDSIARDAVLKASHGSIRIGETSGGVEANLSYGDLDIDRATSSVSAKTAYGAITLNEVSDGVIDLAAARDLPCHNGLVLLSDVDALYDGPPAEGGSPIARIEDLAGKAQRFFDTRGVAADSDKVERL